MKDITTLLKQCQALGATLTPMQGRLRIEAPQPLPNEIIDEIRAAKSEIMAELQRTRRQEMGHHLLEEWRRTAIPAWRRILQESSEAGDTRREAYARWILTDILEDTEGGNQ